MTNPLRGQPVAVRGFRVLDNSLGFAPGTFIGSGQKALDVDQLTGQDSYTVGTEVGIGWKFKDGSSVEANWTYFSQIHYRAGATFLPAGGAVGNQLENTFLYTDVFNLPPQFSGPDLKVAGTNPGATFGIWNAATIMTLDFIQRFQQYDIIYREPIFETETYRLNGLVGPRFSWIWEKFRWRTTDANVLGFSNPQDVGLYDNVVSNRMYGAVVGCDQEYYLGHGFVLQWKVMGALLLDSAKEEAKYYLQPKYEGFPQNKHADRVWSIVPQVQTTLGIQWYPTEFVQIYVGYELWAFWNTLAAQYPINFNSSNQADYANVNPHYNHVGRVFDGIRASIALSF